MNTSRAKKLNGENIWLDNIANRRVNQPCVNKFISGHSKGNAKKSGDRTFKVPIDNRVTGWNELATSAICFFKYLLYALRSIRNPCMRFNSLFSKSAHTYSIDMPFTRRSSNPNNDGILQLPRTSISFY